MSHSITSKRYDILNLVVLKKNWVIWLGPRQQKLEVERRFGWKSLEA